MTIKVDQRTVRFERDDEALAELAMRRADWLERELELARLLSRIDRKKAYRPTGCNSVTELAARRGFDGRRMRELCGLGHALEAEPELERLLRNREISFEAACELGRIHRDPELLRPDDEWSRWARTERLPDLKRRIRRRIETVRQGERADVPFLAQITARVAANLARCREVAARKVGRYLTNGQLLDVLSTGYLAEHDVMAAAAASGHRPGAFGAPWGVGSRARRLPPTTSRPKDRTIPAQVVRGLEERSGGVCEFGGCQRPAQEICHLVPHAEGGGRELDDLVHGCHGHHAQYDAGLIRFMGWTREGDPHGADLPVFLAAETNELLLPKPRPGDGLTGDGAPPEWLLRALGRRLRLRLRRVGAVPAGPANGATPPRPGRDPDR